MSDACQNVRSYIAEAVTYFQLPVVSRCSSNEEKLHSSPCSFHSSIVIYRYHPWIVILISIISFLRIMRIISFENNYYNISIGHDLV